jgi:succinoglycan biosynthesis protein ExoM
VGRLVDGVQALEARVTAVVAAPAEPVLVCICTYQRNDALRRLLARIAELAAGPYAGWRLGAVVVDDNRDGSAQAVAEEFADRLPAGVAYRFCGTGNIAEARNLALEAGIDGGAWLALLDDDEMPTADWLAELVRMQRRTDADLVMGVVRPKYPAGAPRWLAEGGFQWAPEFEDGTEPPMGFTGNVLIRAEWLKRTGHRFDTDWGAGGEDIVFFARAKELGAGVRYAAKSLAWEDVELERTTLRYQVRRHVQGGLAVRDLEQAVGHRSRLRLIAAGLRMAGVGAGQLLTGLAQRRQGRVYQGLATGARAAGIILGALGVARRRGR